MPLLQTFFKDVLGDNDWDLEAVQVDRLIHVNFHYPQSLSEAYSPVGYIGPAVRLEIDPRPENDPIVSGQISSFVADHFPDQFETKSCSVIALAAERAFWEKITLLHRGFQKKDISTGFPPEDGGKKLQKDFKEITRNALKRKRKK